MKKSILITGISGVGKSTVSNKLNALGYKAYDVDDIPGLCAMIDKKTGKPMVGYEHDNLEKVVGMDWICDSKKLKSIVVNESGELAFYCGISSNIDEVWPLFDLVILLKVGHETTRHRLTHRTDNDFGRTKEVQDWIMTWKDRWEADVEEKGAVVIDAHRSIDQVVEEIIEKAKAA